MARTPWGGYTLIDLGTGDPEGQLNTKTLVEIQMATAGIANVNVSGTGSYTLGAIAGLENDKRTLVLIFTGPLTGNRTVVLPASESARMVIVYNNTSGAFTLTLVTDAGGSTGVAVPQGHSQLLWHDGVNVYAGSSPAYLAASIIGARVYNSANQSINHATSTLLTFNSEVRDDGSLHSTSSLTSRLTALVSDWHIITFVATYAFNATGFRAFNIKRNGGNFIDGCEIPAVSSDSEGTLLTVTTLYYLNAGDYVEVFAYQTSGGALNVTSINEYSPHFAMAPLNR